jgi:hypothetical protein
MTVAAPNRATEPPGLWLEAVEGQATGRPEAGE